MVRAVDGRHAARKCSTKKREVSEAAVGRAGRGVVSKLPGDCEQKRPIIERIHQRLANLPQEVPQIPVTPLAELDRMLAGAQAMLLSMPEAAQVTESLRQMREMLRSHSAGGVRAPRPRVPAGDGRRSAAAAADAPGRVDARAAASERSARERGLAFRRQDRPLPDAGLQQGEHLGRRADGPVRQRRAERRSRGHRQPAASLRGVVGR